MGWPGAITSCRYPQVLVCSPRLRPGLTQVFASLVHGEHAVPVEVRLGILVEISRESLGITISIGLLGREEVDREEEGGDDYEGFHGFGKLSAALPLAVSAVRRLWRSGWCRHGGADYY